MFDTSFASPPIQTGKTKYQELPFKYEKRILMLWEEHCLECAPPYCYNNCSLFKAREDSKCVRLQHGLRKTDEVSGSLPYGIDCTFRKWAKLEAFYTQSAVSDKVYLRYDNVDKAFSSFFLGLARLLKRIWPTLKPYGAYVAYRWALIRGSKDVPNVFYIKCILKNKERVQLLVQMDGNDKIYYSQVHTLKEGDNELIIPLNHCLDSVKRARVFISPLNEETDTEIIFSWVDFFCGAKIDTKEEKPADKVKVLVWDLDNTLWEGTLVNDKNVRVRENAIELIKALDSRGILNTISSKNDFDEAIAKLKEFGIEEYFLCPAINWGQKSVNIKKIAETLNLGINSFAFIDDNIREREEVSRSLPMIRVYSDSEMDLLLEKEEFNVPISEESSKRRLSYIQEVSRQQFKEQFSDDYDNYLRQLGMQLAIKPVDDESKERCYELLSRSNQLNLTTHRYSQEEFVQLINNKEYRSYSVRCKDKFGDYGIISFISFHVQESSATITDFVISCRVAKKKVENAIVRALAKKMYDRGVRELHAYLIITKKNGPLTDVFKELPFEEVSKDEKSLHFVINDLEGMGQQDIIKVNIE